MTGQRPDTVPCTVTLKDVRTVNATHTFYAVRDAACVTPHVTLSDIASCCAGSVAAQFPAAHIRYANVTVTAFESRTWTVIGSADKIGALTAVLSCINRLNGCLPPLARYTPVRYKISNYVCSVRLGTPVDLRLLNSAIATGTMYFPVNFPGLQFIGEFFVARAHLIVGRAGVDLSSVRGNVHTTGIIMVTGHSDENIVRRVALYLAQTVAGYTTSAENAERARMAIKNERKRAGMQDRLRLEKEQYTVRQTAAARTHDMLMQRALQDAMQGMEGVGDL